MADLTDPHIVEATQAARDLRERIGIPVDRPIDRDLLTMAERDLELAVTVMEMPEGVAGAYLNKRGQAFVFLKATDFPTRQRFTLAHEIGHHTLGHQAVYESEEDIDGKTKSPQEQQANYFASEFLAPPEAVREWLRSERDGTGPLELEELIVMADRFHLSPPAMLYRLSTADFGVERGHLTGLWNRVKYPKLEHVALSEQMGITTGSDKIAHIYESEEWPRMPAGLEHNASLLHEKGLIDDDRLAAVLRRS